MNKFDNKVNEYLAESQQSGLPHISQNKFRTIYYLDPEHTIKHREDGPATIYNQGGEKWYLHNKLHRVGGPAVTYLSGDKYWYEHGELHREDGPAVQSGFGKHSWYIRGQKLSEEEFNEYLKKKEISNEIQSHKNNRIDPGMLEDYL